MVNWFSSGELSVFYIISQLFALGALILNLTAIQKSKKPRLLKYTVAASTCAFFHFLFLGAWPGVANKAVTTVRNTIAFYEAKKKKTSKIIPIIFVAFYIICGIISFRSIFSLFPILASSIYTIAIYTVNISKIRKYALLSSSLWLVYNISILSAVGMLSEVIFISNDLIAIYRYKKTKKKNKKKK